ncbi:MAG: pilin [Arenimonas sp.]
MRCFLLGFAGFFLAALLTMFAVASYGDYAARGSLADTLQSMNGLQAKIAENILSKHTTVGAGDLQMPPAQSQPVPLADYLKVVSDGTIVFRSAKHGQIIVLEPTFNAGVLSWKCTGSKPDKNLPPNCRH